MLPCHRRSKRQRYFGRTAAVLLVLQMGYSAAFVAAYAVVLAAKDCELRKGCGVDAAMPFWQMSCCIKSAIPVSCLFASTAPHCRTCGWQGLLATASGALRSTSPAPCCACCGAGSYPFKSLSVLEFLQARSHFGMLLLLCWCCCSVLCADAGQHGLLLFATCWPAHPALLTTEHLSCSLLPRPRCSLPLFLLALAYCGSLTLTSSNLRWNPSCAVGVLRLHHALPAGAASQPDGVPRPGGARHARKLPTASPLHAIWQWCCTELPIYMSGPNIHLVPCCLLHYCGHARTAAALP